MMKGLPAAFAFITYAREDLLDIWLYVANPMQPILLAPSALDIGVDALARAGVADVVRRPLVGAELASRACSLPRLGEDIGRGAQPRQLRRKKLQDC